MITKEIINGKEIEIEWEFIDIEETHSLMSCDWNVLGVGVDGKTYQGNCFADSYTPQEINSGEVLNIEEI